MLQRILHVHLLSNQTDLQPELLALNAILDQCYGNFIS